MLNARRGESLFLFAALAFLAAFYATPHLRRRVHVAPRGGWPAVPEPRFRARASGLTLHYRRLGEDLANPDSILVIAHGFGEKGDATFYGHLAKRYNEELNVKVFAVDHAGHGASQGELAFLANFSAVVEDFLQFAELVKQNEGHQGKLLLHGHSFGGLVALNALHRRPNLFQAALLESPLIQLHPKSGHPALIFISGILDSLLPHLQVPGTDLPLEGFTRNPEYLQLMLDDTTRPSGGIFVHTGQQVIEAMADWQHKDVSVPYLLITGDDDIACEPEGAKQFFARSRAEQKQFKLYPGARHALHHEPNREKIIGDIIDFFKKQL